MLDENGNIVDIFPIFSTIAEGKTECPIDDNGNSSPRVIGDITHIEKPSEFTNSSIENAVEIDVKRSESSPVPFVIGGLAIVGIGTGIVLYKKKK